VRDLHALIVGAGIGGLTTALALQQSGLRVSIYEQAAALAEVGAGLTVASNGSLVLQHLGLGPVLKDLAVVPDHGAVKHFRTGRTLVDIPRGMTQVERFGAPYCQIHRNDLHQALVAAVRAADPDCLHLDCALEDFGQDADGVTALFNGGRTMRGDLLVGCDGIRSTVRTRLFGAEEPRFTGYVAWRGLVPMERLNEALVVPDSAVWIGPGHFLTRYKIRRGELLNYVAIARTNSWVDEGWSVRSTVDAMKAGRCARQSMPCWPNSATSNLSPARYSWPRHPTSASSGACSTGIRCQPGPWAASRCWVTPRTRSRPFSGKAR